MKEHLIPKCLGGMGSGVITWKLQMHKEVPVRLARVFAGTNEQQIGFSCIGCCLFQSAGCAKELTSLKCNLLFSKSNPRSLRLYKLFLRIFRPSYSYAYDCVALMMITSPTLSITLYYCPLLHQGSTISKAISW